MRVVVTGGGGFLGSRICKMLHDRGDQAIALGRNAYPRLHREGISTVRGDVCDPSSLRVAFSGAEAVLHVAAKPGVWGPRREYWEINALGTMNVIDACRTTGVPKLIYTSSPSVVFGKNPLCGVDESQPYPRRYEAHYAASKAEGERWVLAANDDKLATTALRPHLIFGPGDPHLFPRIIARAQARRLIQVGNGDNLVDVTYIDNAAHAHLLALDRLKAGSACAGRAYFISQGAPVNLWNWLNEILTEVGFEKVHRRISEAGARSIGVFLEAAYRIARVRKEPPMTRFLAGQLARSHYFCVDAAKRDLGYIPRVTTPEGVKRLVDWLKNDRMSAGKDLQQVDAIGHD